MEDPSTRAWTGRIDELEEAAAATWLREAGTKQGPGIILCSKNAELPKVLSKGIWIETDRDSHSGVGHVAYLWTLEALEMLGHSVLMMFEVCVVCRSALLWGSAGRLDLQALISCHG